MNLFLLFLVASFGVVLSQKSCTGACGNAIQIEDKIVCYCHALCVLEQPGKCCDDFQKVCPAEYDDGKKIEKEGKEKPKGNLPQMPAGCALPDSNVIPVPEKKANWEQVGKTCKANCGTAMIEKDEAVVCFCDSSCLLTADCCPDFIDHCPVDPCILALVMPTNVDPDAWQPGSCKASCGKIVPAKEKGRFCSCETACVESGSCCDDFKDVCPNMVDVSLIKPVPVEKDGSCFGKCGGGSDKCWCDYQCISKGDCCPDYTDMCGASFGIIMWTGHGSCHQKCGGAGFDCWCDSKCEHAGDCCDDYLSKCKTKTQGTCKGNCGGFGGGCWCDDKCAAHGDCCADKKANCKA